MNPVNTTLLRNVVESDGLLALDPVGSALTASTMVGGAGVGSVK